MSAGPEPFEAALSPRQALATAEHVFGVLPLLESFAGDAADPVLAAVRAGERRAALGCFTPNPELSWRAAAITGTLEGDGLVLTGVARLATIADATLLIAHAAGELRLALVDHGGSGVSLGAAREGVALPQPDRPCWLRLDRAPVPWPRVSAPIDLDPTTGEAGRRLEAYAGIYARLAADQAWRGARALRRVLRTARHGDLAWSGSQLLAFGLTEIEIEIDLLRSAIAIADENPAETSTSARPRNLALAASAARMLAQTARQTSELAVRAGLAPGGPFAEDGAQWLEAFLGGAWMTESELARTLGL